MTVNVLIVWVLVFFIKTPEKQPGRNVDTAFFKINPEFCKLTIVSNINNLIEYVAVHHFCPFYHIFQPSQKGRSKLKSSVNTYQLQLETGNYIIRQLLETEAHLYKDIRLEAIQTEPVMFRCSTPAESELTDAEWRERVMYPRAIFGLFKDDNLIGMTSILLLNDEEGYLGQSFIRKDFRGLGLSSLFYKIRFAWASKLALKRLKISHRESNTISKAAIQSAGFKYSYREPVNWLDGTTEDAVYYVLEL